MMLKKLAFVTIAATSMMIASAQTTPAQNAPKKGEVVTKQAPAKVEHKAKADATQKAKAPAKQASKKVEKDAKKGSL